MNELKTSNYPMKNSSFPQMVDEQFTGPLPHPSILEHYERLYVGASKIIIENFIAQSNHRKGIERLIIKSKVRSGFLGLLFAFIIALTTIVGAIVCILFYHEWAGTILGFSGLGALTGVYLFGCKFKDKGQESSDSKASTL